MIDLIGDVHGHADELEKLLTSLGYTKEGHHYSHPTRKVLFVGDYIDRGPKIRETLEIVKQMVDNGSAIALLGNHEYNALCYHMKDAEGKDYLRPHSKKNNDQHKATLDQFENREEELAEYIEWFKSLPLFYETDNFRAVHACWDYKSIDYLKKHLNNNRLTDDLIRESVNEETELFQAIEHTLKGKEIKIPTSFYDKGGYERFEMRYKWWEDLTNKTCTEMTIQYIKGLTDEKINMEDVKDNDFYKEDDKIVFFGHYWLKQHQPSVFRGNICCLDYSVADSGYLVAYSLDDELRLDNKKFTRTEK